MEQPIENKRNNNSGLKAAVVVLLLLLIGSGAYIYKLTEDSTKEITTIKSEKEQLIADIENKIAENNALISEKTTLEDDFKSQNDELQKLLTELQESKATVSSMQGFKNKYYSLKRENENLVVENNKLKQENVVLTSKNDSLQTDIETNKKFTDTLLSQNDNLTRTIEKGSKLAVLNLNVLAVKERSSGKQIETDKASRADKLKISFLIAENQIAKSGDRTYYVQVLDSSMNVLGDKLTIPFDDQTLTYSFITKVKYENKSVKVDEEIKGKDFKAGSYFVNVFNSNGEKVSGTNFTLR